MTIMPPKLDDCIADDLVVRARVDQEALVVLYDTIYPSVFRYCLRRSGNRSLAEDITSTVFLSVADKIAGFSGDAYEEFRRWVFTIATNELNADYRKTNRRKALLEDAANSGLLRGKACGEDVDQDLEWDALQAAILKLSDRAQAIITMRFFAELQYEDIAHILSISPGTTRTAASRALGQLRDEFGSKT